MKLHNIVKEMKTEKYDFNMGEWVEELCVTEEEVDWWRGYPYMVEGSSYEVEVDEYEWTYQISLSKGYMRRLLTVKDMFRVIDKLSRGDRGAVSKQLYPYLHAVCNNKIKKDASKIYKHIEKYSITKEKKRSFETFYDIRSHSGSAWGSGEINGFGELEDISSGRINSLLSYMIGKGYVSTERQRYARRFSKYMRSNTYYKITDKGRKCMREYK